MKLIVLTFFALFGSINGACPANLEADVVFVVDTSTAVDKASHESIANTLVETFGSCKISAHGVSTTGVRIAIINTPGDDWGTPLVVSSLSTITSTRILKQALANTFPDPLYDPVQASGQTLLNQALQTVNRTDFINNGYRDGGNHVIIYITTTSSPDARALEAAQKIRTSNTYGFLAISYKGNGVNTEALNQFVGGKSCVLSANNENDLSVLGVQLINLINQASQNGGNYNCQ
uniref:VWFA domain-containing protein n=1 Tax=Acrobeloides nanus TaxID=290746 RepID=A0A914CWA3_9BILA